MEILTSEAIKLNTNLSSCGSKRRESEDEKKRVGTFFLMRIWRAVLSSLLVLALAWITRDGEGDTLWVEEEAAVSNLGPIHSCCEDANVLALALWRNEMEVNILSSLSLSLSIFGLKPNLLLLLLCSMQNLIPSRIACVGRARVACVFIFQTLFNGLCLCLCMPSLCMSSCLSCFSIVNGIFFFFFEFFFFFFKNFF